MGIAGDVAVWTLLLLPRDFGRIDSNTKHELNRTVLLDGYQTDISRYSLECSYAYYRDMRVVTRKLCRVLVQVLRNP